MTRRVIAAAAITILTATLAVDPVILHGRGPIADLQTAAARTLPTVPDLDEWVARAMRTFSVPGLALAIVKDDAVVVATGYGVRKLGEPAKVDGQTLFGIASNTKAFTATALGLLVEERKIEW